MMAQAKGSISRIYSFSQLMAQDLFLHLLFAQPGPEGGRGGADVINKF